MAQKHVLVTFNRAPYGSIYYTEGLRAAVGVTSGIDEHTLDIVYLGDGVLYTLRDVDRSDTAKYLGTLSKQGYKLKVEKESLEARGIAPDQVAEDVEVIPRQKVLELINKADLTIDF
jgi:sulfur relay (sulfurtransferase) DsrF/TusC family protein